MTDYITVLCQEIHATPPLAAPLQTIFFGGGTPSLLSVEQMEQVLATLESHFGLATNVEISMELDPGTFTLPHLRGFLRAGVNRVSLGIQAFQEHLLQACGRSHTVQQSYEALEILGQAGVKNFSLDLMSGLPGQTLDQWDASLERAIAVSPPHLSTYDLVVEPTTVFGKQYQPGQHPLPSDESTAQMYRLASHHLAAAGYRHYEVSNYAREGFACRHNQVYWRNQAYYGFGMGATSYVGYQRFSRPRTRVAYFEWVRSLIADQGQIQYPVDTQQDRLLETLMLGLRLAEGLQLQALEEHFGTEALTRLITCLQAYPDWSVVDLEQGTVRLTEPDGFLFSNQILVALWEALSTDTPPAPYTGK